MTTTDASGVLALGWLAVALPLLGAAVLLLGGRPGDERQPSAGTPRGVCRSSRRVPQYFSRLASSTEAERRVRKIVTMIARPTTTSAAATTMTKNAMIWPSRCRASGRR